MSERNVSGVTYEVMDFLNMTYTDNSFDVVVDKGSFDAICLDDDPESEQKYTKYLNEQIRVLDSSANGKFLIVSLLQRHVFDALLEFFLRGKNNALFDSHVFDLQLYKLDKICNVQDTKFVSFLLSFSKRPLAGERDSKIIFKESIAREAETIDEETLKRRVKMMQYEAMVVTDVKEFRPGQVFQQSTEQSVDGVPRYTLIVRDAPNEAQFAQKNMCCFVVPLGCEREMDIFDEERQLSLLEQTTMARLVIVILGRGHVYESLDQIKEELNPGIVSLTPADCTNKAEIPYLSSSRIIHLREVVFENNQIIIEDFAQQDEAD